MSAVGVGLGRMSRADGGRLLRLALRLDAAASGALGLLLAGGGSALGDPLGASATVLIAAGVFLIGYAMGLWLLAARRTVSRPAAWVVIGLNLLWVAESGFFATTGLTTLGTVLVVAQAAAVLLIADLQLLGLRRAR
jgi:hypothetical protein